MSSIQQIKREASENARKVERLETRVAQLTRPVSHGDRRVIDAAFRRADVIYQKLGLATPAVMPGESALAYRRRLADPLRRFSPAFRSQALHDSIVGSAFDHIESVIYHDAEEAAKSWVRNDAAGRLREVKTEEHGKTRVEFYGDPRAAWEPFMPPNRTLFRFSKK